MPLEERFITFSLDEVFQAVKMRCIRENLPLPQEGKPVKITMDEQDVPEHVLINLHIQSGYDHEPVPIPYERTFFALALVFYCQGSGIPLPSKGKKNLKILEDKIVMKIMIDNQPDFDIS